MWPQSALNRFELDRVYRGRGLVDLDQRVNGIHDAIDEQLRTRQSIKILEIGCGFGLALLQLRAKYGDRVKLFGLNSSSEDGDSLMLELGAKALGLPPELATGIGLTFHDVADGLPYPDQAFDLVFSQVAWLYFPDKLRVLMEVQRVLSPHGLAKIECQIQVKGNVPEYRELAQIWSGGAKIPFFEFVASLRGISVHQASRGPYLQLRAADSPPQLWQLIYTVNLRRLAPNWFGHMSVYRLFGDATSLAREIILNTAEMTREGRFGFRHDLPNSRWLLSANLEENGTRLGPPDSIHDEIRDNGRGIFSVWESADGYTLYFSSSDNTDPRDNRRRYVLIPG